MSAKTSLRQQVTDLKASNEFLTTKALNQGMLLEGAQESLDTSTKFILALLLKAGGSVTLTPEDYRATAGLFLQRAEDGENVVLSIMKPAASDQH